MAPSLHQPHDHLFRLVFADSEETAAFLRARLPDSLRRRFLWSSLRRSPGSFVDQTQVAPAAVAGALRGRLLQLAMMHTFEQAPREARERIAPLLEELQRKPARGEVDYYRAFMEYIVKAGPADTLQALDELMLRRAPELRGDLMTCGEMLRREGELKGRQEGELSGRRKGLMEAIDGFLRAGVEWQVIQSATGIDQYSYRTLKRDASHGTEPAAPR